MSLVLVIQTDYCRYLWCYVALKKGLDKDAVEEVFSKLDKSAAIDARQLGIFLSHQPTIAHQQRQTYIPIPTSTTD